MDPVVIRQAGTAAEADSSNRNRVAAAGTPQQADRQTTETADRCTEMNASFPLPGDPEAQAEIHSRDSPVPEMAAAAAVLCEYSLRTSMGTF